MDVELFRPMLAASFPSAKRSVPTDDEIIRDLERLDWSRGFLCSPKLDGIRAVKHPTHGLVSRTLKPIPNKWIQHCLRDLQWDFLDGELVKGHWSDNTDYNTNQSAIMSYEGKFEFTYAVFDHVGRPEKSFRTRNSIAQSIINAPLDGPLPIIPDDPEDPVVYVQHLPQVLCSDIDALLAFEAECLIHKFEGVIARDAGCRYKNGRATWRQQGMFKMKRFIDAEAEIIDFEELVRNFNDATIDARGYQVRSDHLDGMLPADTLGLVRVRGLNGAFADVEFGVGSGFDDSLRHRIWQNRSAYMGRVIKYKYQSVGNKDRPRAPIFIGFRND